MKSERTGDYRAIIGGCFYFGGIMRFCVHDWKRIEKVKHAYYDYGGIEVLTAMCVCKKCGKKKVCKFSGKHVGQIFS